MDERDLYIDISERLKEIIYQRFGLDFNQVKPAHYDVSLLDRIFSFAASDLLYLFFDVEQEFGIRIPENEIENNNFSSFLSIVALIQRQLTEELTAAANQ